MANALTAHSMVIPRAGAKSSMPQRLDSIAAVTDYWIVRLRGR
jgi:hypothetical protein